MISRSLVLLMVAMGPSAMLAAAEPFLKPRDVIALVGGGDMALMREHPGLEVLVRQQPGLRAIRFRILAQEGDTVFEQFRDLNFPSWEEQLDKIGATVVFSQFGRMELLQGNERIPEFIASYETLLNRFAARGRRVVVISPMALGPPASGGRRDDDRAMQAHLDAIDAWVEAQKAMAARRGWPFVDLTRRKNDKIAPLASTRSGRPASCYYYGWISSQVASALGLESAVPPAFTAAVLPLVKEKNSLWFHYWWPQNWAFLAGDRTQQPSSRDHRDPTKRWFPAEMETWLPLIEAKEEEIQAKIAASGKP